MAKYVMKMFIIFLYHSMGWLFMGKSSPETSPIFPWRSWEFPFIFPNKTHQLNHNSTWVGSGTWKTEMIQIARPPVAQIFASVVVVRDWSELRHSNNALLVEIEGPVWHNYHLSSWNRVQKRATNKPIYSWTNWWGKDIYETFVNGSQSIISSQSGSSRDMVIKCNMCCVEKDRNISYWYYLCG